MLDSADNNQSVVLEDPYDSKIYSVDSGDVEINIKGRIRVSYKTRYRIKSIYHEQISLSAKVQISALDIIDGFVVEENGYFYEQSEVTNIGYWPGKN